MARPSTPPSFAALALIGRPGRRRQPVVVPYFDGERTPNLPTATGSVHGLRPSTSAADIARAAHLGVLCGLLDGRDELARAGAPVTGAARLVGGGANSPAYRQLLADLVGDTIVVPTVVEAVATGACVQAAVVAGGEQRRRGGRALAPGRGHRRGTPPRRRRIGVPGRVRGGADRHDSDPIRGDDGIVSERLSVDRSYLVTDEQRAAFGDGEKEREREREREQRERDTHPRRLRAPAGRAAPDELAAIADVYDRFLRRRHRRRRQGLQRHDHG